MQPINFYVVPRATVNSLAASAPIPPGDLAAYLDLRPGILDDGHCDIFERNSRSEVQRWSAFELFERKSFVSSGTVVVFPFMLELFENFGVRQNIKTCIDWLKATYPGNPCVIQWNHDRDAATVPELQDLPDNFFVLNFNTSRPTPNDVLLPFWTIQTVLSWSPTADRQSRGGFCGHIGGIAVRQRMADAFRGKPGWWVSDERRSQDDYLSLMQSWDFALCPRGGGLSSYRFYEAIQCGSIPILFADDVALPFSEEIKWGQIALRFPEHDAGNFDAVNSVLQHIDVKARRKRLMEIRERCSLAGVQREVFQRISEFLK